MAGNQDGNRDFEETNSKLAEGLKTCRTVVSTYRALLSSAPNEDLPDENGGEKGENGGEDAAISLEHPVTSPEAPDLSGS